MAEPLWDNNKGLRLLRSKSPDNLFLEVAPDWLARLKPFMELKEVKASPEGTKGWWIPTSRFPHINLFLEAVSDLAIPDIDSPGYLPERVGKAPVHMLSFQEFKLLALLLDKDNTWFASIFKSKTFHMPGADLEQYLYYPFKTVTREMIRKTRQWGSTQFVEVRDPLKRAETLKPAGIDWIPEGIRVSDLSDAFIDALAQTPEQLDIESRYIQNRGPMLTKGIYNPDTPITLGSGDIKRYMFIYVWVSSAGVEYTTNKDVFLYDGREWILASENPAKPLPLQFTCPLPFPVNYFTSGIAPIDTLTPSVNPDFDGEGPAGPSVSGAPETSTLSSVVQYDEFPPFNEEIQQHYEIAGFLRSGGVENVVAVRLTYNDGKLLWVYFVSTLPTLQPDLKRVTEAMKDPNLIYIGFSDEVVAGELKLSPEEQHEEEFDEEEEDAEEDDEEAREAPQVQADEDVDGEALPAEQYMPPADTPWDLPGNLEPVQVHWRLDEATPVVGGLPLPGDNSPPSNAVIMRPSSNVELPAAQSPRGSPPIQMEFPQNSPRPVVGGLPTY